MLIMVQIFIFSLNVEHVCLDKILSTTYKGQLCERSSYSYYYKCSAY